MTLAYIQTCAVDGRGQNSIMPILENIFEITDKQICLY